MPSKAITLGTRYPHDLSMELYIVWQTSLDAYSARRWLGQERLSWTASWRADWRVLLERLIVRYAAEGYLPEETGALLQLAWDDFNALQHEDPKPYE